MLKPIVPKYFGCFQPDHKIVVYRASHGGAWIECDARDTAVIELSRDETIKMRDYLTRLLDEP